MNECVAIDTTSQESLQDFSRYLWRQGVVHRIIRNNDRQVLLVGDPELAGRVRNAYQQMLSGCTTLPEIKQPDRPGPAQVVLRVVAHNPVTLIGMVLSLLGFCLVYFDRDFGLVRYLTFFEFDQVHTYAILNVPQGQYWRLITPIFLHFSLMHIGFNMALFWFVGRRLELLQGSLKMLGITMIIGLGSNVMQAVYAKAVIFGGMSGVVYGLLGYAWVWSWLRPQQDLMIPNALFYFSLAMMALGFIGLSGLLGVGEVANVAHLGGLVIGCLMGLGAALLDKAAPH